MIRAPIALGLLAAGTSGAGDLLEGAHISITTMAVVGMTVFTTGFWLSKSFTRISDRLDNIEEKIEDLPCKEDRKHKCK